MKVSEAPETFPIAGPDWRGTLQVWRDEHRKARRLSVLLPDGSEVPVTRDQIEDGDDAFHLPVSEADLRRRTSDPVVVPALAEEVVVDREAIPTDRVKVRKYVDEHVEHVELPVAHEKIDVRRVAINRVIDSVPQVRDDGELMVIPVVQEELIVTKQLVLKEEIHIRRTRTTERAAQDVTLRAERAEVLHTDAEGGTIEKGPRREQERTGRKYRFLRDW